MSHGTDRNVFRFKPKHETEAEWQKEARFLLSLRHPNIIQIYDMFEYYGLYYLIVEECHGSLRNLVESTGPLHVGEVIAIAGQMLSGTLVRILNCNSLCTLTLVHCRPTSHPF